MTQHPASKTIQQSLGSALGQDLTFMDWQPVSGGCIHQAWQVLCSSGQTFFIKTNQAQNLAMFQAETVGLQALKSRLTTNNPLQVPEVYAVAADATYAWLITQYITFGQDTSSSNTALGQGLALLHQQTAPTFGFDSPNFIGESTQTNTQETDWTTFFIQHRLNYQFELAKHHGFYQQLQTEAAFMPDVATALLLNHQPKASLLHGDLWAGNKASDQFGRPILFDPASYYGDRECDLAMTELFGGFSAEFYTAYDDVYPIAAGYQQRKDLYNLYHILNHANLFGGHYIQQSKNLMQKLTAEVT